MGAKSRPTSCVSAINEHPRKKTCWDGTTPELRLTTAAAQRRIIAVAKIRRDPPKSVRPYKGIICANASEFESDMPSQRVRIRLTDEQRERIRPARFRGP